MNTYGTSVPKKLVNISKLMFINSFTKKKSRPVKPFEPQAPIRVLFDRSGCALP